MVASDKVALQLSATLVPCIENLKIHCADEHFKEISNCEVKFAAVSSYEKMMDIVQLK